jgi:hypothetical protein
MAISSVLGVTLTVLFSVCPDVLDKVQNRQYCLSRVEAGSNTSTVAMQVVGGDEKGTQCLGV